MLFSSAVCVIKSRNFCCTAGAKAITAGVAGAIPDTLSLAYNLPAMAQNAQVAAGNYQANPYAFDFAPAEEMTAPVPLIPSATEAIDQGIDTATGGYTTTPEDQKYINEGLKTGASFLTGGGLAKTAQGGIAKLGSMIGSTSPLQAAGAAAMGGTTSYLADQGAGTGARGCEEPDPAAARHGGPLAVPRYG